MAVIFLLGYAVGIPLLFLLILVYHKRTEGGLLSPLFAERFGALTAAYQPRRYYYEIVHIACRATAVLSVDLLTATSNVYLQVNVAVAFTIVFLLAVLFLSPYQFVL